MSNQNLLTLAQNTFWYSTGKHTYFDRGATVQELSNTAFAAGAKWSIKQTSELSPYIAKFIEMMILLGYLERE